MKTKHRLAAALKELMERTPLDLISVQTLTEKCGLNRQTFYYHFRNLYDLLMWIFLNENVPTNASTINEALTNLFIYLEEEYSLIDNALNSAAKDLVMEFLFNKTYNMNLELMKKIMPTVNLRLLQYDARFMAAGLSNIIIAQINEELDLSFQDIISKYELLFTKTVKELMENE